MTSQRQFSGPDGPRWILRRRDQLLAAGVLAVALAALGLHWAYQATWGRGLIDIDRAEPREIRFAIDINQADWPDATTGKHFANTLVFSAKDLPKRSFYDHRQAPGVEKATAVIRRMLANGPASFRDVVAAGMKAGVSRTSVYKAARRLGVQREDGVWSLPAAAA